MKCRIFSLVLFLALLLCWAPLSGLTPEEREKLPTLSKESLIKIILVYDNNLNTIESSLNEREAELLKRKNNLSAREADLMLTEDSLLERENELIEKESHLNLRESLLAESYRIVDRIEKQNFWTGFIYGSGIGAAAGGIAGYNLPR